MSHLQSDPMELMLSSDYALLLQKSIAIGRQEIKGKMLVKEKFTTST
jgi:hypothetical protein